MAALIQDKEHRLSSRRYQDKDMAAMSIAGSQAAKAGDQVPIHGTARRSQNTFSCNNINSTASSSKRRVTAPSTTKSSRQSSCDLARRYVFDDDASDIKAHKWFRHVPWDHLHEIEPPFVPSLRTMDDTHYFEEEDEISDWSESSSFESEEAEPGREKGLQDRMTMALVHPHQSQLDFAGCGTGYPGVGMSAMPAPDLNLPMQHRRDMGNAHLLNPHVQASLLHTAQTPAAMAEIGSPFLSPPSSPYSAACFPSPQTQRAAAAAASGAAPQQPSPAHSHAAMKKEEARQVVQGMHRNVQKWALSAIATPYDAARLRTLDAQVDAIPGLTAVERSLLRHFVRAYGRREKKRPRDRLLRDRATRRVVMDVRKRTAFLGYTWRRPKSTSPGGGGGDRGGEGGEVAYGRQQDAAGQGGDGKVDDLGRQSDVDMPDFDAVAGPYAGAGDVVNSSGSSGEAAKNGAAARLDGDGDWMIVSGDEAEDGARLWAHDQLGMLDDRSVYHQYGRPLGGMGRQQTMQRGRMSMG